MGGGFEQCGCQRVLWKAFDGDFSMGAGLEINLEHGV